MVFFLDMYMVFVFRKVGSSAIDSVPRPSEEDIIREFGTPGSSFSESDVFRVVEDE